MQRSVLITGAVGGIGLALCREFASSGYRVIALDCVARNSELKADCYLQIDLDRICTDEGAIAATLGSIMDGTCGVPLGVVVNNAATQVVRTVEELSAGDWTRTLNVNVLAPFLLVKGLLPQLEASRGAVINISSIHARLTKPGFSAYATSKAALDGLTRSLAVELGGRIRVNGIAPAAIATTMLRNGFAGREIAFQALAEMHPTKCIGEPEEVARLALYLASESATFTNGSIVALDGGIGSRLHDPV